MQPIAISVARTRAGETVLVSGRVTMLTQRAGAQIFYLADESGGLQVQLEKDGDQIALALDAPVRVRGRVEHEHGRTRLVARPGDVEAHPTPGAALPPTKQVSLLAAAHENEPLIGRLIQTQGTVTRVEATPLTVELILTDPNGTTLPVYIDPGTNIPGSSIAPGDHLQITGILETDGQRVWLWPRQPADWQPIPAPELSISLHAPALMAVEQVFKVTVRLTNHRPETLHNLVVAAPLPAFDFKVESVDAQGWQDEKRLFWEIATLAGNGGVAEVGYQAQIISTESALRLEPVVVRATEEILAQSAGRAIFLREELPIWAIQGRRTRSPYVGETVPTRGIVTGVFPALGGVWIQTTESDYDPQTSEGLFVQVNGAWPELRPGDAIELQGVVREIFGQTSLAIDNPDDIRILSSANPLPLAVELLPPAETNAAQAYYEPLEGMLVQITGPAAAVLAPTNRYGEVTLMRLAAGHNTGTPIIVDDGRDVIYEAAAALPAALSPGERVTNLIGPLAYTYGGYKLEPIVAVIRIGE